ncbi:ABC transporter [Actinoplanes sp. SE50]|uniref:ABC transporter ATP-binding protein n=1 Tax=unclassified Actinoplanes TaxID=2626549 RepID=UPI00023ED320|nr:MULTISPECIES: ABC transporter ATP-binding protein [unclassified Actinoplanes]AEV87842.1 Lipid A export ATP-binding/permease protein msbA [Actinoplanes sp. SE50/110]ATO86244.1 ABC transporter [Actinoplanes sp. SE50]SLM03659.1 ABC transporter [Actinoplanes sp. SE50/110]
MAGSGFSRAAAICLRLSWAASRPATVAVIGLSAVASVLPATTAWFGKELIDELTRGPAAATGRATVFAVAAALAGAVFAGLAQLGTLAGAYLQRETNARIQERLFAAVNGFHGVRRFEDPAFRDRLELAGTGAQQAPESVTTMLSGTLRGVLTIAGYAGVLLTVWPPMLLLLALAAVPAFATYRRIGRRAAGVSESTVARIRRQLSYRMLMTEAVAAREVRLFGLGRLFAGRFAASLRETSGAELADRRRAAGAETLLSLAGAVVALAGTLVMIREVAAGRLSVGGFSLFTAAAIGVQGALTSVLSQIGMATRNLALFHHYAEVVGAAPDLADGDRPVAPLTDAVTLDDVWFRYDEDGPWILRGVTLRIPRGATVGLVGLNGAGKSTLVKLLCRFYDPQRGTVRWDGTDLRDLRIAGLRRRLGAAFQDFVRYDLTAAENIGVGDVDRLDDRPAIRAAARAAGIDAAVEALPKGYDTLISRIFLDGDDADEGVNLSGGQWQRLAVARALMREDCDLVILDEPNAGLDADADAEIQAALRAHAGDRTTLLVSHRLGTLRHADEIVVLSGGRITERGDHDTLLAAGGEYARLFRKQSAGYVPAGG